LVEHAIGAAGGGDVADESFDLALGEAYGGGGEEEEEMFHGVCVWNRVWSGRGRVARMNI